VPTPVPRGFLWGAATSSHQVEGGNDDNDWSDWERERGHVLDGTVSGAACEWWQARAEDDLTLAASLGHNAHRLSLEWSRLEPEPGRFDAAAFARYARMLDHARGVGLEPCVTVHHFTLPKWVARDGSWTDERIVGRFARYAEECVTRLGAHVRLWATMNEPSVLAFLGYAGDRWPPGLGDPRAAMGALARMLRAHAAAYEAMRSGRSDADVGLVINLPALDPASRAWRDRAVTRAQDWIFNGVVLHALETGWLLPPLVLVPTRVPGLRRSFAWLGLNYYGRYEVRFDARAPALAFGRHVQEPSQRTAHNDWGQISPDGLERQLLRLARIGVPLYVTENGVFALDDRVRERYVREHVAAVGRAIARGADVRGYFHWSLVDNFEWAEGYSAPFGLVEVDRATQRRTPRPSAGVYADLIRAGVFPV